MKWLKDNIYPAKPSEIVWSEEIRLYEKWEFLVKSAESYYGDSMKTEVPYTPYF